MGVIGAALAATATAAAAADIINAAPVDIASAATTNIGAASSPNVRITGTTPIISLGTAPAGTRRFLTFAAVLTITYNATSLQTPGLASIITAAGDNAVARSLGSGDWVIESYTPATAAGLRALAEAAPLPTLSAGVGEVVSLFANNVNLTLPAGGTWRYEAYRFQTASGTNSDHIFSIAAGGTLLSVASSAYFWRGGAWRIA
jgi:hypothetical protein